MDWSTVTAEDLVEALRKVDWSLPPPRPIAEFFSRCRTNYFILIIFILGMGFLRKPLAIVTALMTALSIAFLNDTKRFLTYSMYLPCMNPHGCFAGSFSEKVTRTVRQISPHLAAKMRPTLTLLFGKPICKTSNTYMRTASMALCSVSFILWLVSCGIPTILWALAIATVIHASFRTANLKARLNTFREEFRAVW